MLTSVGCGGPLAALASIDDAHIACFGRFAEGRFARPRADATVLLECLRLYLD